MIGPFSYLQIKPTPSIIKNHYQWVLKCVVSLAIGFYLYQVLEDKFYQPVSWPENSPATWWMILWVLILMPVNWLLEAQKWQFILGQERISLPNSLKQVLRGLALNWILPFTSGDIVARMGDFTEPAKKSKAILYNRLSSLLITLVFGLIGIAGYLHFHKEVITFTFYVHLPFFLLILISPLFFLGSTGKYVFSITLLRYLVFSLQFYVLISLFLPFLSFSIIFSGIAWIFLIRSVLPGILGAIGIREASAVFYFSYWLQDPLLLITPALLLWTINIVIPSIAGTLSLALSKSA